MRTATAPAVTPRTLVPAELTWLALLPCAIVLLAAIVLLGPPLGRAAFLPSGAPFWRQLAINVLPEPTEHARYVLALLGPLALSGVVLALRSRIRTRSGAAIALAVHGSQALLLAGLLVAVGGQHTTAYRIYGAPPFHTIYFTWPTFAVAALLVASTVALLRRRTTVDALAERTRETTGRRRVALALAAVVTAAWLLTALNSDGSVGNAQEAMRANVPFWLDETFSVLNGRAPLVDFHSQYGQLWPYLAAGAMSLLGTSFGVYTTIMATAAGAALLALFATLRRVVRSSSLALALYLPVLATGFFMERGPLENRYAPANAFSMFPMRYAGPYLLAWLTARALDGAQPRRRALLFVVAGIVAINNVEFGVPAFGATLGAVAWTSPQPTWRWAARLAGDAAAGLAGAAALVALVTLAVAGSLPHFGLLTEFPRLYGVDGFGMLPMATLGLHLALYATFAAAIVLATVRAVNREQDVVLTGMLAWSGIFGLGVGAYFVGRSHPEVLIDLFSAWALALALLTLVAIRALLARPSHRPTLAELAVLFGFGIAVCSLAQVPTPWSQIERIGRRTPTPAFLHTADERFVARATTRGEHVAITADLGHRIAYEVGIVNVSPYASDGSLIAREQLQRTLDVLRREGGRKLFVPQTLPEEVRAIKAAGFRLERHDGASDLTEYMDRR